MLVQALFTHLTSPTQKRTILSCRWVGISPRSSSSFGSSSRARKRRGARLRRNGPSSCMLLSMILTAAVIPSLSMECSVKSSGMERAEWGGFQTGSRSITLRIKSRWEFRNNEKRKKLNFWFQFRFAQQYNKLNKHTQKYNPYTVQEEAGCHMTRVKGLFRSQENETSEM